MRETTTENLPYQPVLLLIAYFVVQWEAGIVIEMLAVAAGAFLVTIGLCELAIKRGGILRVLFKMKPVQAPKVHIAAAQHLKR